MGAQLFYSLLFFFLNLPFTLLFFRLLKNIPGKYRTLTCLLPFLSGKVELADLCIVVSLLSHFCYGEMYGEDPLWVY